MALALEIQKAGWKGAYVNEYMAVGEVHPCSMPDLLTSLCQPSCTDCACYSCCT